MVATEMINHLSGEEDPWVGVHFINAFSIVHF